MAPMTDSEAGEQQPLLSGDAKTSSGASAVQDGSVPVKDGKDLSERPSVHSDIVDTFRLGVPIFIASLSWVGMKTTDTALLGHVSSEALSAAALSDLWTMCTAMLISGRSLDILVGGAIGAGNPKLAGVYLQVAYYCLAWAALFVIICWNITGALWKTFGSDPEVADMAGYYSRILSLSIPGQLLFGQLSQFFSAQKIMHPEVNASLSALAFNLVVGLVLVLGVGIPSFDGFGFTACPAVTASAVYVQLFIVVYVYIIRKRLHANAWDGWSYSEITWPRIKTFCELYFPAALSIASDFWRVAVIGTVAANMGEEEVAVFNTSYRIMWIVLVLVIAMSGASGINMSIRLGKMDPFGARQAGYVGISMAAAVCIVVATAVLIRVELFGRIFTDDEVFLSMLDDIKVPFVVTLFLMNVAVAIEKIPYSMGRTTAVFWMGFVASWGGQVPAVLLLTKFWRDDLYGLYCGMAIGYGLLVLLYGIIVYVSDWEKYAEIARLRSAESMEIKKELVEE